MRQTDKSCTMHESVCAILKYSFKEGMTVKISRVEVTELLTAYKCTRLHVGIKMFRFGGSRLTKEI